MITVQFVAADDKPDHCCIFVTDSEGIVRFSQGGIPIAHCFTFKNKVDFTFNPKAPDMRLELDNLNSWRVMVNLTVNGKMCKACCEIPNFERDESLTIEFPDLHMPLVRRPGTNWSYVGR